MWRLATPKCAVWIIRLKTQESKFLSKGMWLGNLLKSVVQIKSEDDQLEN
jgi:hypothetical protein